MDLAVSTDPQPFLHIPQISTMTTSTSTTLSFDSTPVTSLLELSLDEWVTMVQNLCSTFKRPLLNIQKTVTKTMDPHKREACILKDEPMPFRDLFILTTTADQEK
jgi:hypothetical protein